MKKKFKTHIFFLGILSAWLLSAMPVKAEGQLNVSCSFVQVICDAAATKFEEDTGITVHIFRLSAGEAFARIRAEARNPKIDVWYVGTVEPHLQAADEDLTQSYQSPNLAHLHPWAYDLSERSGFKMSVLEASTIGFVWNKELLKEKNLAEPRCWADLLRSEYAQEISMSNPNTAGTGYFVLANLVNLMGEDAAFDYLKKLNTHVVSYSKSGSGAATQAARGETSIGIVFLHDAIRLAKQGFPLGLTAPCEGVGLGMDGMSIVKGAKNLEGAKKFVDWALSAKTQSFIHSLDLYSHPSAREAQVPEGTIDPANYKILDLDLKYYGSSELRKRLLGRWDREIGTIAGQ